MCHYESESESQRIVVHGTGTELLGFRAETRRHNRYFKPFGLKPHEDLSWMLVYNVNLNLKNKCQNLMTTERQVFPLHFPGMLE